MCNILYVICICICTYVNNSICNVVYFRIIVLPRKLKLPGLCFREGCTAQLSLLLCNFLGSTSLEAQARKASGSQ